MTSSKIAPAPGGTAARGLNGAQALALGIWLFSVGLSLATLWMVAVTLDRPAPEQYAYRGFEASIALPWGLVGGLIALRRPRHRLGWFLLAIAVLTGTQGVVDQYPILADAGLAPVDGSLLIRWVSSWEWIVGMAGLLIFLPLMFPDGHLPSPRWRPVLWLGVLAVVGVVVGIGAATRPIGSYPLTRDMSEFTRVNPFAEVPVLLFVVASGLAVVSLVRRFVRSAGEQRQQLKWVVYGGVVGVLGLTLDFAPNPAAQAVGTATATMGAACVGIAILRYRLYEIDLIINRTFVYGALTAILAGVYTASITLSTRLFSAVTGERSDAAIVLTTLIVVSLYTPLKARLQTTVDKRLRSPVQATASANVLTQAELREQLTALHAELHAQAAPER